MSKNFSQYSVDPTTRYPNVSLHLLRPNQVRPSLHQPIPANEGQERD